LILLTFNAIISLKGKGQSMKAKTAYQIRMDDTMIKNIEWLSQRIGRERSVILRDAFDLSMPILMSPDYYTLRLQGVTVEDMVIEVKKLFHKMALEQHEKNVKKPS
jgi:hypothetical protein